MIVHDVLLPLVPLEETEDGDRFKNATSSNNQCVIFVESKNKFSEEYSFDEPYIV